MRRLPVVLVTFAVALSAVALLGSPAVAASGPLAKVTVSTDTTAKPTLQFDQPFGLKTTADEVVVKGTGDKLVTGQDVGFDYLLVNGRDGTELQTSWGTAPASFPLDPKQTAKTLVNALTGVTVGSRVLIAIAPKEGLTAQLDPTGATVKKNDTLLFVIDVRSATTPPPAPKALKRATGEAVAPVAGLPTVKLAKNGKPTITVAKGATPPTQLVVQPLIKGAGAVVQSGQTVTVHYTGIIWDTGKQFDSSWDRKQPAEFAIGVGQVIPGWDQGIVGQTVGSQLLLVVPPDQGYGAQGQSSAGIKPTDTLVFVVDILATQ